MAVVKLVDEYFGQVRCIDLSGNRLRYLDYLANLVSRTKHVQALNLANNQVCGAFSIYDPIFAYYCAQKSMKGARPFSNFIPS